MGAQSMSTAHGETPAHGAAHWLRWLIAAVVVLAVIAAFVELPIRYYLQSFLIWTQSLGFWAYGLVILIYIVACVLAFPGALLTLSAGFLFGVIAGSITVLIGATLGACAAFLVGRFLARERVEAKLARYPKFRAIDEAVGRAGFKIVLLTRLSPLFPFNLLNYAFGLTKVRFGIYALATLIGIMPGTVLYVYLGSTAKDLTAIFSGQMQGGPGLYLLKVVGLAATVIVTVVVTRIARRALKEAAGTQETKG